MTEPDLIIIGAGPAGMAAATLAATGGLQVLLLDQQDGPGGQIYRNIAQNTGGGASARLGWLGKDYAAGARLAQALDHPRITVQQGASVWRLEPRREGGARVVWTQGGTSHMAAAPHILLAVGAQERPTPFPGWTLPGVMTAGAAQILMKTAGLLPRGAILAGSGPLLYLVAAQMIAAGTPPQALVETQTVRSLAGSLRYLPRAMPGAATLLKGLGLIARIRAAGVPRYTGARNFEAAEAGGDIAFSFDAKGTRHRLTTPLLLTHQGVIPATHLSRSAGIAHEWNAGQRAFRPMLDIWGAAALPGLYVAGDGAGIGGAEAAEAAGRLAALDILRSAGCLSADLRDQRSSAARAALRRARSVRPFLDAAYPVPRDILSPPDATIICRCEEVTAGQVRQGAAEGARGPRGIKTSLRTGMGPCQGRMCDASVREILGESAGGLPGAARIAPPRARSPIIPVRLGELADMDATASPAAAHPEETA